MFFDLIAFMYQNKTIIQNRAPESGHATVKHFTETVEFKRFVKVKLFHTFLS